MASTNSRASVAVACGALLALSLLAGCQLGPGGAQPTAKATSTTAAPPMADYARQLTTDAERIRSGITLITGANTYVELRTQIRAGTAVIADMRARWHGIATPTGTKAAHDRYLVLLAELHRWIVAAGNSVSLQRLCAAPPVLQGLNRSGIPGKLDSIGRELAALTGGLYKPVQLVLVSTTPKDRSLPSGTMVRGRLGSGSRAIRIDNSRGTVDLVLILTQGKRPVYSIYAKRKSKVTIHGVASGTYRASVVDGRDWDRKLRAFTRDCSFWRFKDSTKLGVPPNYYDYWQYWFNRADGKDSSEAVDPEAAIQP